MPLLLCANLTHLRRSFFCFSSQPLRARLSCGAPLALSDGRGTRCTISVRRTKSGLGDLPAVTTYRALGGKKTQGTSRSACATGDLLFAGAGWLWVVVGGVVEPVEGGFVAGLGGVFLFFVMGGFGV